MRIVLKAVLHSGANKKETQAQQNTHAHGEGPEMADDILVLTSTVEARDENFFSL